MSGNYKWADTMSATMTTTSISYDPTIYTSTVCSESEYSKLLRTLTDTPVTLHADQPVSPDIDVKSVKIIENEEGVAKGVIVTFEGDDVQKSICSDDDVFNLEVGFMICIAKHALHRCGFKNPTKELNKGVRKVFKKYDEQVIAELEEEEKKKAIEFRKAKRAEKKKRRAERKAAAERERQIDIQSEAILRAMRQLDKEKEMKSGDDLK